MKYPPNSFCPIPTLIIPFVIVTILLAYQLSNGQSLASNSAMKSANEQSQQLIAQLDPSSLINSRYTTFFGYTLTGKVDHASIRVTNSRGNFVNEFSVEPDAHGAISLPANLLHEGNYHIQLIADGKIRDEHDLRVIQ